MNKQSDKRQDGDRDEMTMARLLKLAGPREPVPPEVASRVYERVEQEWRASTGEPDASRVYGKVLSAWKRSLLGERRRWAMPLAIAASAALVVAVVMQPQPAQVTTAPMGTVVRAIGNSQGGGLPAVGRELFPGDRLETGPAEGIGVRLASVGSFRVDQNSALRIAGPDRISLLRGRIYADTGDLMYRNRQLVIETPHGEVTDVGTQFAVSAGPDLLEVAVREGRVDISRPSLDLTAVAGERLRLEGGIEPSIERLEPYDAYWDWVSSLAPAYDLENRSLLDFLRWAARESGRELVFQDRELRMAAMRTDLHGSVSDFDPLEAVESVLATTTFHFRIEQDRIVIER